MLETIFVIVMFAAVLGASIFGWWYENYGPDKEEGNK